MKTEKQMAVDFNGLLSKVSDDKLRNDLRVAFGEYRDGLHKLLLDCALNLGHTAYEYSSSTSIGIDNLREKALDFLEIPKED